LFLFYLLAAVWMKTKEDCATVKEESCVIVDFRGRAIFIFSMHNQDRWEPKVERKKNGFDWQLTHIRPITS
jgi:hypothetical protein